jgi:hypothetical protein
VGRVGSIFLHHFIVVRHAYNLCFGAQRIRGMLLNDVSS